MYFGMFYDPTFLLLIPAIIFAFWAQIKVSSAYNRYSKIPNQRGITGAQAARHILDQNGLQNIGLEMGSGKLSDHFDPRAKVIRLSPEVYNGATISAVSIAAHESGHAVQFGTNYVPLKLRNAIAVPTRFISWASWPLLIIGILVISSGRYIQGNMIFNIGIIAFLFVVVFHAITLPVEVNASRRAIKILNQEEIILPEETKGAKKVLSAAAMTYVAALAMSIVQLLRIILIRGRS